MTTIKDHYRHKKVYHLVYYQLIMAARNEGVVTYKEIAELMGLQMRGNHMSSELGHILGEISEDEVYYDRPMLSALAVSSVNGKPGIRFYAYAKGLGRLKEDTTDAQERFWEQEKLALYETWKNILD